MRSATRLIAAVLAIAGAGAGTTAAYPAEGRLAPPPAARTQTRVPPAAVKLAGSLPPDARPVPGTAPAIVAGRIDVVAWLQDSGAGRRVLGLAANGSEAVRLGPSGAGGDGAPTAAAIGGAAWIMAARNDPGGSRLWAQRWADGSWQAPFEGPSARPYDHHPVLAADSAGGSLWATWLGEDAAGAASATIYASRWTGAGWSAPEPLPRTPGSPMAPAMAIDHDGIPAVAWAGNDGNDAEIWISRREAGRWSTPRAISSNPVPDITPSLTATPAGMVATWISYTDDGYLPVAAIADDDRTWSAPRPLDTTAGDRPRALVLDGTTVLLWRRIEATPAAGSLVARAREGGDWGETIAIAPATGSPFSVTADGGRVLLAFSRPDGRLAIAAGAAGTGGVPAARPTARAALAALAADAAVAAGPVPAAIGPVFRPAADGDPSSVPVGYTAFGDSITNGVVYDPDRNDSPGYRGPLQELLRGFFGVGAVYNAGVDGETTAGGVGRIDNAIRAQDSDAILILEGTNDILDVIEIDVIAFNLRRMVQRSYEEKPDILPFLAQLPPRLDPGPDGFDGSGNGRIDELNSLLPEIAEEEGAVVVDMNTPIDGHPELMSNHVHPSAAGYQVMAEVWFEAARPAVLARTNRGDIDGSGRTDGFDLIRLALAFGATAAEVRYDLGADINGDGMVDGFDLDLLVEFFGIDHTPDDDGEGGS